MSPRGTSVSIPLSLGHDQRAVSVLGVEICDLWWASTFDSRDLSWIFPVQSERFYQVLLGALRSKSRTGDHGYPVWPALLEPGDADDMANVYWWKCRNVT